MSHSGNSDNLISPSDCNSDTMSDKATGDVIISGDNKQQRFQETVQAIHDIIDKKLYREKDMSIEDYFKTHWDISRAQAYRLYNCGQVLNELKEFSILPNRERYCRIIKKVTKLKQERVKLWAKVIEIVDGNEDLITSGVITDAWNQILIAEGRGEAQVDSAGNSKRLKNLQAVQDFQNQYAGYQRQQPRRMSAVYVTQVMRPNSNQFGQTVRLATSPQQQISGNRYPNNTLPPSTTNMHQLSRGPQRMQQDVKFQPYPVQQQQQYQRQRQTYPPVLQTAHPYSNAQARPQAHPVYNSSSRSPQSPYRPINSVHEQVSGGSRQLGEMKKGLANESAHLLMQFSAASPRSDLSVSPLMRQQQIRQGTNDQSSSGFMASQGSDSLRKINEVTHPRPILLPPLNQSQPNSSLPSAVHSLSGTTVADEQESDKNLRSMLLHPIQAADGTRGETDVSQDQPKVTLPSIKNLLSD
ncbi:hypothetical protein MP228_002414 [Amoeboaphelidium protococcarum]|nr:hypothetical protein MP228_002414 [Amoeboaphelidium protococcarum]